MKEEPEVTAIAEPKLIREHNAEDGGSDDSELNGDVTHGRDNVTDWSDGVLLVGFVSMLDYLREEWDEHEGIRNPL